MRGNIPDSVKNMGMTWKTFYVQLHSSSNGSLQYPCWGWLQVQEVSTTGQVTQAAFVRDDNGIPTGKVGANFPVFTSHMVNPNHFLATEPETNTPEIQQQLQDMVLNRWGGVTRTEARLHVADLLVRYNISVKPEVVELETLGKIVAHSGDDSYTWMGRGQRLKEELEKAGLMILPIVEGKG